MKGSFVVSGQSGCPCSGRLVAPVRGNRVCLLQTVDQFLQGRQRETACPERAHLIPNDERSNSMAAGKKAAKGTGAGIEKTGSALKSVGK